MGCNKFKGNANPLFHPTRIDDPCQRWVKTSYIYFVTLSNVLKKIYSLILSASDNGIVSIRVLLDVSAALHTN